MTVSLQPLYDPNVPLSSPRAREKIAQSLDELFGFVRAIRPSQFGADLVDRLLCLQCVTEFPTLQTAGGGGGSGVPVGTVAWLGTTTAPDSTWLRADGTAVSRTTYSDLNSQYSANSYPFGNGDGSTTFNLPDADDSVLGDIGSGRSLGDTGGSNTFTLTTTQLPAHTHSMQEHTHDIDHSHDITAYGTGAGGTVIAAEPTAGLGNTIVDAALGGAGMSTTTSGGPSTNTTSSTGSGTAFDVRQPTLYGAYFVKVLPGDTGGATSSAVAFGSWPAMAKATSGSFGADPSESSLNYDFGSRTRSLPTVAFTIPAAGNGWTLTIKRRLPDGFKGWRGPVALKVLQAIKSWTKVSTNLDIFVKVLDASGTAVATKTVTYSSSEDATELTELAINSRELYGQFGPGDLFTIQIGTPSSGNTGAAAAAWVHHVSQLDICLK